MLPQKESHNRLISLDVFRGLTITVMILVNSPGNSVTYSWLQHANWNGCSLADLVFPFFIVIVGMSSVLGLQALKRKNISNHLVYKKIILRSLNLFLIGLLLNAFPNHFDVSSIRIFGVLQRIAICYFFSSYLCLTTRVRTQAILVMSLLVGYWFTMNHYGSNTLEHNLVGYLDQFIFSSSHLYLSNFDPEGLLSTLPAIASVLLGNLMGYWITSLCSKKQKLYGMLGAGVLLSSLGFVWSFFVPLNKALWSSSYVLWSAGLAFLVYAFCYALIEINQIKNWSKPFSLFGRHAMLIYVLHVVFLKLQVSIQVYQAQELINLKLYITQHLFGHLSLKNASLSYALTYTLLWLILLYGLEFKKNRLYTRVHSPV